MDLIADSNSDDRDSTARSSSVRQVSSLVRKKRTDPTVPAVDISEETRVCTRDVKLWWGSRERTHSD